MTPIDDAPQRRRALDPTRSFIVQAPAGSGKTELLTQRFLRLLAGVGEPEEIVAITFTRKAAAEMRNRILSALDRASGPPPEEAHARTTWELARAALARDQSLDWALRANPNRLRVMTFDSLCAALARQLPVMTELGAPPVTEEDAEPLYRQAARATLARLNEPRPGEALALILRHLDNQLGLLEELLTGMLARRDQWLPHILDTPESEAVAEAVRHQVETHLAELTGLIGPSRLQQLARIASEAADRLPPDKQHLDLACWSGRQAPPSTGWEDLPCWLGLAQLVLTNEGSPRSPRGLNKNLGFPPDQKAAKAELSGLIEELAEIPGLPEVLDAVRRLPPDTLDEEQNRLLDALGEVLMDAAGQLMLVFQESGRLDFVEVQQRALQALGAPGTPSEVALRLDHRIQHLLVDEFQDTSSGQYRLLERLTGGWSGEDGRTLFLVGDPMQSIYRFRKAEVGLFLQTFEGRLGEIRLEPLRLTMNFRSRAGIVAWVNQTFEHIFPPLTDLTLGGMPYAPSRAIRQGGPAPAVQIHPCPDDDPEHEALKVRELVQASLAEDPAGRIAILVRARSHMPAIARALKEAGLRFRAVQAAPLASQPTVQDLQNLTRALLHPQDRLAWLSLLRSPLVGLTLEDIAALCEGDPQPLWALIRDPNACRALSPDGQAR
ncbi:MAG: DNA helicase UvrD, partial [Gammaproteobacteria bacterium]